jgi:hypothetical protein
MTTDIPTVNKSRCLEEAFGWFRKSRCLPWASTVSALRRPHARLAEAGRLVGLVTSETIGEMLILRQALPAGVRFGPWDHRRGVAPFSCTLRRERLQGRGLRKAKGVYPLPHHTRPRNRRSDHRHPATSLGPPRDRDVNRDHPRARRPTRNVRDCGEQSRSGHPSFFQKLRHHALGVVRGDQPDSSGKRNLLIALIGLQRAADRRGNRGTRFRALVLEGAACGSECHRGLDGFFDPTSTGNVEIEVARLKV